MTGVTPRGHSDEAARTTGSYGSVTCITADSLETGENRFSWGMQGRWATTYDKSIGRSQRRGGGERRKSQTFCDVSAR